MLLQLLACQARVEQLEGLLADSEARLQQAQEQGSVLAAERDAAARNLLRAEAELNDVSDYSTKMYRQVGGVGCRHAAFCFNGFALLQADGSAFCMLCAGACC